MVGYMCLEKSFDTAFNIHILSKFHNEKIKEQVSGRFYTTTHPVSPPFKRMTEIISVTERNKFYTFQSSLSKCPLLTIFHNEKR